jgi:hypothetical protein
MPDALRRLIKEISMRGTRPIMLLFAGLLSGALGCSDTTSPGDTTRPPANLNVVRVATGSPPLFNPEQSFYAVQGQDREVRISFQDQGGGEGEEFLRFRVRPTSLLAHPDGTPFVAGDSVLITVQVLDPTNILFQMEPTGLTFNPAEPAELKIHYDHADHDFNEDGIINATDDQIKSTLAIWRQETAADNFVRLGSVNVEDLEEINADILGFTRYAIAY